MGIMTGRDADGKLRGVRVHPDGALSVNASGEDEQVLDQTTLLLAVLNELQAIRLLLENLDS